MADKPPFDVVRGVFWLITITIVFAMILILLASIACGYKILRMGGTIEECRQLDLRDIWQEVLTTLLVLLNTRGREPPPPPPDKKDKP